MTPQERAELDELIHYSSTPDLDFSDWLLEASPTMHWEWRHLVRVRYYLSGLDRGEFDRLLLTLPPRHGKSELVTIRRPAYRLEINPRTRTIVGAYNSHLATRFSRRTRAIVRERGRVALSRERSAADDWETVVGGSVRAVGVNSGVTGTGAEEIIIDDPVKSRAEANSEAYRETCWDWYKDDLYTRLEPTGTVILIMTRWHEDDVAGRMLISEEARSWVHCDLPAIAIDFDEMGRAPGEALCPERYDLEKLERIRRVLGSSFDALYQGRPRAAEGEIILTEWFVRYAAPESIYRLRVQSWDTANKEKELSDWNVCTTWGIHANTYDLLDEYRARLTYPKLKRAIIAAAEKHSPDAILIEDRGNGTAALQDLKVSTRLPVIAVEPIGDKIMRLSNESPAYEAGIVRHPTAEIAPWITPFESELVTIPNAAHDDRGDSVSQFLHWAKKHAGRMTTGHRKPSVDDLSSFSTTTGTAGFL